MASSFGQALSEAIATKALGQEGIAELLDCSQSYISYLVNGQRAAPDPDRVEAWARALELDDDEQERFMLLADLSRTTDRVRGYVADLEAQLASKG